MKVQIVTLGCSKNRVDSEHILFQLKQAGVEISPEGEELENGGVDAVILNTCGFINEIGRASCRERV